MEIWKSVSGLEGYYEVSNMGNVKSLAREYENNGIVHFKERILRPRLNSGGYIDCCFNKYGKQYQKRVHRIVAQEFIENPENKKQVNHINGIKTDNRAENLEWCTSSENNIHTYKMGRIQYSKGKRKYIPIDQYSLSGEFIKSFSSQCDAIKECGLSSSGVSQCCRGILNSHKGFIWKYKNTPV